MANETGVGWSQQIELVKRPAHEAVVSEITIRIPDFAEMADEAIQYHHLSRRRDGRWSKLSLYLREHFGTDRLNLNEAWALTPSAWTCPACKRVKVEIARKTRDGVVLCQLERHHDHLGDLAMKILREKAYRNVPDSLLSQRKRACVAALPLIERFAETLVCSDCNAADAAMKSELGDCVHRDFSFSPSEIGAFITAQPNSVHHRDPIRGRNIWEKADAEFQERLRFTEQIAERLSLGLHDREWCNQSNLVRDDDGGMLLDLVRHQLGARDNLPRLGEALRIRSVANDGHRSTRSDIQESLVRTPSRQEFTAHDMIMQRPGPWRDAQADWRCACCARNKFEIMRISGKGKWTGRIHVINDYEKEVDERSIAFRSIHRPNGPIFGRPRQVTVCQDCRLVLTDAGRLRPKSIGIDECLSPKAIGTLVGRGIPHRRHIVAEGQLSRAIDENRQWSDAAADFWKHRDHASEVSLRFIQLVDGRGLSEVTARSHAIIELSASGRLPSSNAAECFDWLLDEWKRLKT